MKTIAIAILAALLAGCAGPFAVTVNQDAKGGLSVGVEVHPEK